MNRYDDIEPHLKPLGLCLRGGFYDDKRKQTIVLIGNVGSDIWDPFSQDIENRVEPDPLDHWTKVHLSKIADILNVDVIFPFEGPDYAPFQQWAMRADCVYPSPIGPLIHPEYGLWHAYRGAFIFNSTLDDLPKRSNEASPCDRCIDKPCLSSCPASVFEKGNYDVPLCIAYLQADREEKCLNLGCLARRACPVGTQYQYIPAHSSFHMRRFLAGIDKLSLDSA